MCRGSIEQVGTVGGDGWTGRVEVPKGLRTVVSPGLEVTVSNFSPFCRSGACTDKARIFLVYVDSSSYFRSDGTSVGR